MRTDTFGNTPAALYLVRELTRLNNKSLTRTIGKRITTTTKAVNELVNAYSENRISPKTLANTMRLMREEVVNEVVLTDDPDEQFAHRLRKNVQVGSIKQAIRVSTIARKDERVMVDPINRARSVKLPDGDTEYVFRDSESGILHVAGWSFIDSNGEKYMGVTYPTISEVDGNTAVKLMERSDKRCLRQGKPHMVNK
jgi:hypothetical protein